MSINRTPHTFGAEDATSTLMNAEVKDLWTGLQAAWTSYAPTWTAATTNPVIGDGTISGSYMQVGKTIKFRISITMGSTTTFGSGQWRLTLPVAASNARWQFMTHACDASASDAVAQGYAIWLNSLSVIGIWSLGTTAGGFDRTVTSTVPIPWANGDILTISGEYEAA